MPPHKGGMARLAAIIIVTTAGVLAFPAAIESQAEEADSAAVQPMATAEKPPLTDMTEEQGSLVGLALGRFDIQGLDLPEIDFVFHNDLRPCHGHKGMFHRSTWTLEMCAMDLRTMLHELAHAWANENLSLSQRQDFVASRALDSWNDHDDVWARRGTEHVAETIAWALAENPHHVKWVETLPGGSEQTTYRILSIGVEVDTLLDNFKDITGMDPVYRHSDEWAVTERPAGSPEVARLGN